MFSRPLFASPGPRILLVTAHHSFSSSSAAWKQTLYLSGRDGIWDAGAGDLIRMAAGTISSHTASGSGREPHLHSRDSCRKPSRGPLSLQRFPSPGKVNLPGGQCKERSTASAWVALAWLCFGHSKSPGRQILGRLKLMSRWGLKLVLLS